MSMLYGFLHRNRNLFGENEFSRGLTFYSDGIAMFVLEENRRCNVNSLFM